MKSEREKIHDRLFTFFLFSSRHSTLYYEKQFFIKSRNSEKLHKKVETPCGIFNF